jgi:hypothetical protein
MSATALLLIAAASVVWMIRVGRHALNLDSTWETRAPRVDLALSVGVGVLLWWSYVYATDPAILTRGDLLRTYNIYAGGGTVLAERYVAFLLFVSGLAVLFAFTGHAICRATGFLDADAADVIEPVDLGVHYFVGMATYLSLLVLLTRITKHAFLSATAIAIVFAAISARTLGARAFWTHLRAGGAQVAARTALLLPAIVGALCLLQWIITKRAGPSYELFAAFIADTDRLPLINRHFGQSLLASLGLMVFGTDGRPSAVGKVLVNNWLYVSQIAFVLVLFRLLRQLSLSRGAAAIGVIILMLGGSALSLLPYIMYDHDYPLIMNIYADSVFGIAGFVIVVMYLLHPGSSDEDASGPLWGPADFVVPAVIMMAFNYTAELDALVVFLVLSAFAVVNIFRRQVRWPRLAIIAVVWALVAIAGARGGGAFSAGFASENGKQNSPFFEAQSDRARMSVWQPEWWYLPYLIVNFDNGFGNLPVPSLLLSRGPAKNPADEAVESYSNSSNGKLIERFSQNKAMWSSYSNLIYIAELRTLETLRALWFPLIGVAGLGVYLRTSTSPLTRTGTPLDTATLQLFWIIAATAFGSGVAIVFFTNAVGGNGVYWKWALTRFMEPGMCLATVALVVALDRTTQVWQSPMRRRAAWLGVTLLMSFGTLYRILCFDF